MYKMFCGGMFVYKLYPYIIDLFPNLSYLTDQLERNNLWLLVYMVCFFICQHISDKDCRRHFSSKILAYYCARAHVGSEIRVKTMKYNFTPPPESRVLSPGEMINTFRAFNACTHAVELPAKAQSDNSPPPGNTGAVKPFPWWLKRSIKGLVKHQWRALVKSLQMQSFLAWCQKHT